ncbi:MAG: hypothetical protein IPM98_22635 [Lewinellaceae bacterium]|nr:hypothetical protein [Lewinellaceae bacterium]
MATERFRSGKRATLSKRNISGHPDSDFAFKIKKPVMLWDFHFGTWKTPPFLPGRTTP